MISKIMLTRDEAYDAMVDYLDRYYRNVLLDDPTSSEDLVSLLSSMLLAADDTPMDSAVTEDWNKSIDRILNKRSQRLTPQEYDVAKLTAEEAYAAMMDYLNDYREIIESEEVATLLNHMADRTIVNPTAWDDWMGSVKKMVDPKTRVRQYLEFFPKE